MKRSIKISALTLLAFAATATHAFPSGPLQFSLTEVPVFNQQSLRECQVLEMSYASHVIRNAEDWNNEGQRKKVYKVDIVFTKYPFHKKDWITHYDTLLEKRINAVCAMDSGIKRNKVAWNLILQTNCETEEEAKNLFHGVIVWYEEDPAEEIFPEKASFKRQPVKPQEKAVSDIGQLMSGSYAFPDSTVFKVLQRNTSWKNMLIVGDWTSSMYAYGAQAVLWHQLNLEKKSVSQFVFFNDGDRKRVKKPGATGGIYFAKPNNIEQVIHVMKKVQRNGTGGDTPENDIEALLKATERTQSFDEVILIADANSAVKDMCLLKELQVPVRVILCGLKKGQAIHHNYLQIVSSTGGSLHTVEEDIFDLAQLKEGERVSIQDIEYQRMRGRIVKAKPAADLTALKARL